MPRARIQRIQDTVHGLMEFQGMEGVVIDVLRTRELQRLRRIRQLGLGYLVFPGAEHSRLVHSLGAAHLAIRFGRHIAEACRDHLVENLRPGAASIRDLAVAALCHDLGHGPLSHAWECEIVGDDFPRDKWMSTLGIPEPERLLLRDSKWHEIVGHALLAWEDGSLHQLLEQHESGFSRRLRYLLRGEYFLPYLPRLLHGDIDVDRADFILRDAFQTGVAYGRYDLGWLISTCSVGSDDARLVVGFDQRKSLRVVEQFLIARRALYETVYYHKTVHAAEGMVSLFLRRLKEVVREGAKVPAMQFVEPMIKMISGEAVGPSEVLALDDFALWVLIEHLSTQSNDETLRDLGRRILSRDLFKMVPCSSDRIRQFLERNGSYDRLYDAIQPFCPGKREFYLIADFVKTNFLSDEKRAQSYFIDDGRKAVPLRENEWMRAYLQRPEQLARLFTLREAVDAVEAVITSSVR